MQIEDRKKIQKIFFILRIFFFWCMCADLGLAIWMLILFFGKNNTSIGWSTLFFSFSFLFAQWCTSYRILSFSSSSFMKKNKILLFTYNILSLNILGYIFINKFLKDDNYNCHLLMENNEDYDNNKVLSYFKIVIIGVNILLILFAFRYIWSYKYTKYLKNHKNERINVEQYNRTLYGFWSLAFY